MANRVDLTAATAGMVHGLTAAVDVAYVTRDVAAGRELAGPAKAVSRMLNDLTDDIAVPGLAGSGAAPIPVADIHANRTVTVPDPLRDHLVRASNVTASAATHAMDATISIEPTQAAPAPDIDDQVRVGRVNEDRQPPLTPKPAGIGCDR